MFIYIIYKNNYQIYHLQEYILTEDISNVIQKHHINQGDSLIAVKSNYFHLYLLRNYLFLAVLGVNLEYLMIKLYINVK